MTKKLKPFPFAPLYAGDPMWDLCFQMPNAAFKVWVFHFSREGPNRASWWTIEAIAAACDMNIKTVVTARRWLVEHRWLVKVGEKSREGRYPVPVYRVDRPKIGSGAEPKERVLTEPKERVLTEPKERVLEGNGSVPDKRVTNHNHVVVQPEATESEQNNNNNGGVVVVPPSPLDVAGYTPEAIAAQAEQCKDNPWVRINDSLNARQREGFVRHLMTLDPPREVRTRCRKCGKRVEADAEYCDKCKSLPQYRRESGQRGILKSDI